MKKLFIMFVIACLMFAGTAFANGQSPNGPPGPEGNPNQNRNNDPVVLTDTGAISGNAAFEYTDLEAGLFAASGVEECAISTTEEREAGIAGSWDRSFSLKESFSYNGGGYAIGGQAQLPLQVAYFDEDMTILGQGGLQLQGAMVEGGASFSAEQGFKNTMVFEGLTMEQEAYQATTIVGTPTVITCNTEVNETDSGSFEAYHRDASSFNAMHREAFSVMGGYVDYTNIAGSAGFAANYSDQSLAGDKYDD